MSYNTENIILFNWSELHYLEYEIELGIYTLKAFNNNHEKTLNRTKNKLNKRVNKDKTYNSLKGRDRASYYFQMYEHELQAIKELRKRQRYSIVLSIYSFYISVLDSLCTKIKKEFKVSGYKNLSGDYDKCMNYLEKILKLNLTHVCSKIVHVYQQKYIRNRIAHNDGKVTENQKNNISIVSGIELIKIGEMYQIDIYNNIYASNLIDNIESILHEILLVVDKRFNNAE